MPLKQNVSGTWKDLTAWINVAGTWKQATVWQNVAGTWKQITSSVVVALADNGVVDFSFVPSAAHAYWKINSNGYAQSGQPNYLGQIIYTDQELWLESGSASDVQVYCTYTGDAPAGSATSTWLDCSSSTYWGVSTSGSGYESKSCTLTLTFRNKNTQATLDTATITLNANTEI
jgi:hypothetical protein